MFKPVAMRVAYTMALVAVGCGGGSGTAKLQLDHRAATVDVTQGALSVGEGGAVGRPVPAELFGIKILSAYLVEDVDPVTSGNVGYVERLWVNPDCPSADGCRDGHVGYFELSDPSAANQALNSQARPVAAGAYRYVRLEFCNGGAQGNIVRYKTAAMSAPVEARYGGCGVTSARMEPPVEVVEGGSVTIALEYDLTQGPLYQVQGSDQCGDAAAPCLGGITLTPKLAR